VLLVGWSRAPGQQVARPSPEKKVQQAAEPLSVQKGPEEGAVPSSESVLARSESAEEEILSAKISPEEEEKPAFESSEAVPEKEKGAWVGDLRDSLQAGAEKLKQSTEELMLRVLPEELPEKPPMHRGAEPTISLSGRALVAVAMVIPLVMLFIVVMTRVQYENARARQFSSLQAMAQSRYDAAIRMEDQAHMRQGLYDALAAVEEGLAINPTDETLNALRRRILHKLDQIDVVERLYHFWKLTEVEDDALSPTDSSRIVIHGIDVYVLNRGSDRVYRFLLNDVGDALQPLDSDPTLVRKGDVVRGVQLGDMVDIAWMEAKGRRTTGSFVILERAGSLLTYDPQRGIEVLPVADSDIWLKPQAMAGYYGNLYVLDPLLGRILKYEPTDDAYISPPSDYLSPRLDVDLTGAVDMAIDGNVYILFADGRVLKFFKGEPRSFSMQGLPSPMRSPTTIFVSGPQEPEESKGYVYIADTGNERVLQFDKAGNYIRQFRDQPGGTHLKKLRGIYVDEERGRMFVLSGKTLWLTNIRSSEE